MRRRSWVAAPVLAAVLFVAPVIGRGAGAPLTPLEEKVRHELVMLPFYNVFDNLTFSADGSRVTLLGQVSRPVLKLDAERAVKRLPGVTTVDNRIEVLPTSFFDNSVRWGVLRAIYGNSALFRYNLGAHAPIRIIVKNGNVTLEGVVSSEMDRNIANLAANGVPGVFSVTNNIEVHRG